MADIFISYARADREKIEKLAAALEAEGYSVWWDRQIESGAEFSKDIERELEAAKAVIVAWSSSANESRWVKDEANVAAEAGKLLAVTLDDGLPPIGFRQYHALDFSGWKRDGATPVFQELSKTVKARVAGETVDMTEPVGLVAPTGSASVVDFSDPKIWGGALAVLAVVLMVALVAFRGGNDQTPIKTTADEVGVDRSKSIAVLPFDDVSPEGDQEYFSDGVSEEILNVLARVDGLRVASRTSSFAFKDKPEMGARAIASELGVRHVVEGSVRKAGDNVRITAQLIDAQTDTHLWAQTFDRTLTVENIFAIQDEISTTIVSELGKNIDLGRANAIRFAAAADTKNLRAYELYLEGRELLPDRNEAAIPLIIEKFEAATRLDPNFARAWEALAAIYMVAPSHGNLQNRYAEFQEKTEAAALRALALDDQLPLAHAARYALKTRNGVPDYSAIVENLHKAIEVDPKESLVWGWRGQTLTDLGFLQDAEQDLRHSLALDPTDVINKDWLTRNLILQGRFDDGGPQWTGSEASGNQIGTVLSLAYAALGRDEEAEALLLAVLPPGLDVAKIGEILFAPNPDPTQMKARLYEILKPVLGDAGIETLPNDVLYAVHDYSQLRPVPPASGQTVWWYWMNDDFAQSPERYRLMREQGVEAYWREHGFPPQCRMIDPLPDGRDYQCD